MSDFEKNTLKRENITAYIIFCVIFAVGSFVFYKKTNNVYWAIILFVCSVILLGFYSRILTLEDELALLPQEDKYEEEIIEEEEEYDEEARRNTFIKNLPAFKKEAKARYNEIIKQLGKSEDCLSDGFIDVWLVDGRIIAMLKWKQLEHEFEDFEGEYADMIIDGMSGRNVEFEYGLERYKNMTKFGSNNLDHVVQDECIDDTENDDCDEDGTDPELAQILEQLEEEDDDSYMQAFNKNNTNANTNLIAQIFEKLMEK